MKKIARCSGLVALVAMCLVAIPATASASPSGFWFSEFGVLQTESYPKTVSATQKENQFVLAGMTVKCKSAAYTTNPNGFQAESRDLITSPTFSSCSTKTGPATVIPSSECPHVFSVESSGSKKWAEGTLKLCNMEIVAGSCLTVVIQQVLPHVYYVNKGEGSGREVEVNLEEAGPFEYWQSSACPKSGLHTGGFFNSFPFSFSAS